MTYKYYRFIYANTRFFLRSFSFYRVLTLYQKSSSSRSSRGLDTYIKGLKRKKRIKGEKSLKLKTLHNIYINFAIIKCKIKLRKKDVILFHDKKVNIALIETFTV